MKRIKPLSEVERQTLTLEAGYRHGPTAQFRQCCHAILLNEQGYRLEQLSQIFGVGVNTVSAWLDRWERHGIGGLYDGRCSDDH